MQKVLTQNEKRIKITNDRIRTWKQLLADPRIIAAEIWSEDNDGIDYWVPLADGYEWEGCTIIHEWSKGACIDALNIVTTTK